MGALPPAWATGGLEPPAGEEDMGSYKAAVYTAEQQARLKVDKHGQPAAAAAAAVGALPPAWVRGEIEAPAGEKDMGSWKAAVYTAEQQARLNVDEFGHAK